MAMALGEQRPSYLEPCSIWPDNSKSARKQALSSLLLLTGSRQLVNERARTFVDAHVHTMDLTTSLIDCSSLLELNKQRIVMLAVVYRCLLISHAPVHAQTDKTPFSHLIMD